MINSDFLYQLKHAKNLLHPLTEKDSAYDPVFELCRRGQIVLVGEASHGTEEFYQIRAHLTQNLIENEGFMAVAIEWDWPDVVNANLYVQGKIEEGNWSKALSGFQRFPDWMWRNKQTVAFLKWLRAFNQQLPFNRQIGIYGLDLYSLYGSIDAVLSYLKKVDPNECKIAKLRYACFDSSRDPQSYGYLASQGYQQTCAMQALQQFMELQHKPISYNDVQLENAEAYFNATQNAHLIKNAETYYRSLFEGGASSWNIRDRHMFETLAHLASFLESTRGRPAKIVGWCHNSHVGDARATEVLERGELNIGQLAKEHYGPNAILIGFTTYKGTVRAAAAWGDLPQIFTVPPALEESYEALFHTVGVERFFINFQEETGARELFRNSRYLHRAIGVVYRPQTERASHYYHSNLSYQYDGVMHIDTSHALEALHLVTPKTLKDLPETYPSGM